MTTHCIATDIHICEPAEDLRQTRLSRLLAVIISWWLARRRRSIDRQAIKHLLTLDDAMLRDVGISRGDVEWASTLPKSADAAVELEIIARGGRGRRR